MRSSILFLAPALLLAGCLTTQENPNYEYSSKYQQPGRIQTAQTSPKVTETTTQSVPYSAPVQSVTYETQTSVPSQSIGVSTHTASSTIQASSHGTYSNPPLGTTYSSAPGTSHVTAYGSDTSYSSAAPYPSETVAPTDAQFAGQEVTGTPGFMALSQANQNQTFQSAQSAGIAQPQRVAYDHSQNFVSADIAIENTDIADDVRIIPSIGQSYKVQQGDTIYALSRKYCVGVDVIRSMNGIGADYAINIGQTITLPASHC